MEVKLLCRGRLAGTRDALNQEDEVCVHSMAFATGSELTVRLELLKSCHFLSKHGFQLLGTLSANTPGTSGGTG